MKIQKSKPSKKHLWYTIPLVASILFAGYSLFTAVVSEILPVKYVVAAIVLFILWVAGIIFLMYRKFATQRRKVIARTVATIMAIILLLASIGGFYVLSRSLSTLSGLSDDKNAVSIETGKSFNIFISGIDTYGDIQTQSRSDVNIVATVNPDTHKILLTTVPRDSYVSIALGGNDGMDKLTHAGNYGVESSMKTVARLLNTDIDAYVRINFTSFIESIDTLGGVTINNPTAFTIDGQHFPVGQLELDGKKALLYSRERKSLAGGDVDRGKNQQRVIQGIVDKMARVRSISGFEALLNILGTSVQTNMSNKTIKSLINRQLDNPSSWQTDSYVLTGKGQTGGLPSYAMPNAQLYMYVLDKSSVEKATQDINAHMEAKS